MTEGVEEVKKRLREIFNRRRAAVYALCLRWAAEMLNRFRRDQPAAPGTKGKFWNNQTGQASARMLTRAIKYSDGAAFRMQHGVNYGVYLELANDRRYQAIAPMILEVYPLFNQELKDLYAD